MPKKNLREHSVAALEGEKWGERYLDEVLAALARFQNPSAPPALDIKNLVIACHSGAEGACANWLGLWENTSRD